MNKYLLFGAGGMAGHVIYRHLKEKGHDIIGTSRQKTPFEENILMDASNFIAVEKLIKKEKPQFIINAIGVLIKGSQKSISNAILMNSYFPHFLAGLAKHHNSKLIHISTDCVFSGNKIGGGYTESDFQDADDVYGRTKALGEVINERDLTIRTSIIGPELKENGEGLFHWFMKSSGTIRGFSQVFWSGVTTFELANAIEVLSPKNKGLIHLTNNRKISKYDMLLQLKMIWEKENIEIKAYNDIEKDKSIRDSYGKLPYEIPDYIEMFQEMKEKMEENKNLYKQYE